MDYIKFRILLGTIIKVSVFFALMGFSNPGNSKNVIGDNNRLIVPIGGNTWVTGDADGGTVTNHGIEQCCLLFSCFNISVFTTTISVFNHL